MEPNKVTVERCGNCKYIGAKTGEDLNIHGKMQSLHFCENNKSIFDACIKTSPGCNEFKIQGRKYGECEYNSQKNNIYDEIKWFLEEHSVSELLQIIADVVESEVENADSN